MSLHKRFTGDYTIESVDSTETLVMDNTGKVTITGDFTVLGDTTIINSTITEIVDNTVVLNSGEDGPGITHPDGTSGIDIDRGDGVTAGEHKAGLRFHEGNAEWQVMNGDDAETWVAITTGGAGLTAVFDDKSPQLGADLDVNGFSITSAVGSNGDVILNADGTGAVKVKHALSLIEQTAPALIAGYSQLYANTAGDGGTGLYFVDAAGTNDELVSRSKAMLYGLIF